MFVLDEKRRLLDLPGYGFAKAPLAAKRKWEKTVDAISLRRAIFKRIGVGDGYSSSAAKNWTYNC